MQEKTAVCCKHDFTLNKNEPSNKVSSYVSNNLDWCKNPTTNEADLNLDATTKDLLEHAVESVSTLGTVEPIHAHSINENKSKLIVEANLCVMEVNNLEPPVLEGTNLDSSSIQTGNLDLHIEGGDVNVLVQSESENARISLEDSPFHFSLSIDDDCVETLLSKSCDYNEEYSKNIYGIVPNMSRSFSDVMIRPSSTFPRKVSVVSTKGKLLGCPRVMPGEKLSRSLSVAGTSSKQPEIPSSNGITLKKKKKKYTTEQKLIAFCLCLVDFASFLSMSIIAPFFPREASAKGMREAVSGFVFSIYALVVMLTSPIFGKLLPSVGARFMFLTGVFFCGVCNVLFGVLDKVDGEMEFTVLCFVVRSFEALGAAAFCTASCTILIDQFPDDIGTVFGFTETCIGIGMSIGPALGGALYSIGGFGLPFFSLGGFVILTVPVCWYLMKSMPDPVISYGNNVSYKKLLSMPHVIVVSIILVVGSQAQGFIDPTLEPHMRQYNLNTGIIGLLFLLLSGTYAIASPIVGWISGKIKNKYPLMIVGLSIITLSLLLIGPSEILPITGSVWLSTFALALLGISFAAAYLPTFECMLIAALQGGLEDDINTHSTVSGLWNSMYSLGEVTGPSLGGILSDFFTFPEASTLMAFCSAAALVVAALAWFNPFSCFGTVTMNNIEDSRQNNQSEHTPLQIGRAQSYGSLSENEPCPVA